MTFRRCYLLVEDKAARKSPLPALPDNPLRVDHDVLDVLSRFDVLRIEDVDLHVPSNVATKAHVEVLQVSDVGDLEVLEGAVVADHIQVVPHFYS